jgi:hypothetical protein
VAVVDNALSPRPKTFLGSFSIHALFNIFFLFLRLFFFALFFFSWFFYAWFFITKVFLGTVFVAWAVVAWVPPLLAVFGVDVRHDLGVDSTKLWGPYESCEKLQMKSFYFGGESAAKCACPKTKLKPDEQKKMFED